MGILILDFHYNSTSLLDKESNMVFKSLILMSALLVGSCYGKCNSTISGYTWKFNSTVDKDFSGLRKEDCAKTCLKYSWCKGYTWSLDDSSETICHIFHELNNQHECQECSRCFSGVFGQITGVCSAAASNMIDVRQSKTEMSCIEECFKTKDCKYYSWGAGKIFTDNCFLFKECKSTPSCESWESGKLECVTDPRQISNPECSNYNELSDATRKGTYGKGNRCDLLGHINASEDWKGPPWYRVVGKAGTKILSGDPGYQHCNTDEAGYIVKGTYPTTPGQSTTLVGCFNSGPKYGNCDPKRNISVTLCNGFYVYNLPKAYNGDDRYCTE